MNHPYTTLPHTAFWRTGVAKIHPLEINELWQPKHKLKPDHKVATAGSCFAQHIGRALAARGYNWFDAEPAPTKFKDDLKREFGYGVFSFRTGNIYTAAALRQWIFWALGKEEMPREYWEKDGRYFDPFRPNIEPGGFASIGDFEASRESTLRAIRRVVDEARCFVFTMGLTEGWLNRTGGHVYAMCPGTVAGEFDPDLHEFHNYRFSEIIADMKASIRAIKERNSKMRFLLTVSPVPLTATASGHHVLNATSYSKSVLRAVAGQLAESRKDTDYFPSYEIITAAPFRAMFYEPNMRSVAPRGVEFVMDSFFSCLSRQFPKLKVKGGGPADASRATNKRASGNVDSDVVCEEEMLDAFGGSGK